MWKRCRWISVRINDMHKKDLESICLSDVSPLCLHWDSTVSGEPRGGGLAALLHNRWCNAGDSTVKEFLFVAQAMNGSPLDYHHVFCQEISLMPLPVAVYIPPNTNAASALNNIYISLTHTMNITCFFSLYFIVLSIHSLSYLLFTHWWCGAPNGVCLQLT